MDFKQQLVQFDGLSFYFFNEDLKGKEVDKREKGKKRKVKEGKGKEREEEILSKASLGMKSHREQRRERMDS